MCFTAADRDRRPDQKCESGMFLISSNFRFLVSVFYFFVFFPQGTFGGISESRTSDYLPRRLHEHVLKCWTKHRYTVVQGGPSRELRRLCRVGAGFMQFIHYHWTTPPAPLQTQSPAKHHPRCVEHQPEPTADGEPKPVTTDKPSPLGATELRIVPEPEPHAMSDQVREPAMKPATEDDTVESEGAEEIPTHRSTTKLSGIICRHARSPPARTVCLH